MAKVYVGTYAKYNAGSLDGKWFDLDDYTDKDDFLEACQDYHDRNNPLDEDGEPLRSEHELMFQDWEDIPDSFISECSIDESFWDYLDYDDWHDGRAKEAFMHLEDEWSETHFQDTLYGEFDSWEDMAEELLESTGELNEVPERLRGYFDYAAYARDIRLNGEMQEQDGFFFWRC